MASTRVTGLQPSLGGTNPLNLSFGVYFTLVVDDIDLI